MSCLNIDEGDRQRRPYKHDETNITTRATARVARTKIQAGFVYLVVFVRATLAVAFVSVPVSVLVNGNAASSSARASTTFPITVTAGELSPAA